MNGGSAISEMFKQIVVPSLQRQSDAYRPGIQMRLLRERSNRLRSWRGVLGGGRVTNGVGSFVLSVPASTVAAPRTPARIMTQLVDFMVV